MHSRSARGYLSHVMRAPLPFLLSLRFAAQGLVWAHRTQRNFRIQVLAAWGAGLACCLLPLSALELASVAICVALVLGAELLNTALEAAVDLASPHPHPLARVAKDVAAGAVVVACLGAVAVGGAIFVPHLVGWEAREGGWRWAVALLGMGAGLRALLPRWVGPVVDAAVLPPRPSGLASHAPMEIGQGETTREESALGASTRQG